MYDVLKFVSNMYILGFFNGAQFLAKRIFKKCMVKFGFSEKATKFEKIFVVI